MSKTMKLLHPVVEQIRSHPEYPALKRDLNLLAVAAILRAARFLDTDPRVDELFRALRRLEAAAAAAAVRLVMESLRR